MPAISESAGWGPVSWQPRSNFAASKDTNKFPSFSENWNRWFLRSRRLSNAGRRRRVSYARAATFHGKSGDPSERARERALSLARDADLRLRAPQDSSNVATQGRH